MAEIIVDLFKNILNQEMARFKFRDNDIRLRKAFQDMTAAYMPDSNWMSGVSKLVNYNDAAHRCAYLHRYAMLHTGLVYDVLEDARNIYTIKNQFSKRNLNVCCLGGGPGSEVVALIFFLLGMDRLIQCAISVIDLSEDWCQIFNSVISELKKPKYGTSAIVADGYFYHQYLKADLLHPFQCLDREVKAVIENADVIFMVKFVSAAASSETERMIQGILQSMKEDSMLVFIDNAAGGFYQVLSNGARENSLMPLFENRYYKYVEPTFSHILCGYRSQTEATVGVQFWKNSAIKAQAQMATDWIDQAKVEADEIDSPNIRLDKEMSQNPNSEWRCCRIL